MRADRNILIKEIVRQLCLGIILKESKLSSSSNRLALIVIDKAAESALRLYAFQHGLGDINGENSDVFSLVLPAIREKNLIINGDGNDIIKYHKICDSMFQTNDTAVENEMVDRYVTLVKILLAYLHDFRSSKAEWDELVKEIRNSL